MSTRIHGLFRDYATASAVVHELENGVVDSSDIGLIGNQVPRPDDLNHQKVADAAIDVAPDDELPGVGTAASVGAVNGAALGILASVGALVIPGLGPVLAAGLLASAATGAAAGAAAGGLIGLLGETGVSGPDAEFYNDQIKQGRSLVTVKASDDEVAAVEAVMARHGRILPPGSSTDGAAGVLVEDPTLVPRPHTPLSTSGAAVPGAALPGVTTTADGRLVTAA